MTIKWDYHTLTAELSIPDYINKLLKKINHPKTIKPCHTPSTYPCKTYGKNLIPMTTHEELPTLPPAKIKYIQTIIGSLLYYAREVDPTMLVAIGTIASQQSHGTTHTIKALNHLLDYASTYPNSL